MTLHFDHQRVEHVGAGRATRADGNRAAIDVDYRRIPAEVPVDRTGLSSKSLVGFDKFDIGNRPTTLFQRLARRRPWPKTRCGQAARYRGGWPRPRLSVSCECDLVRDDQHGPAFFREIGHCAKHFPNQFGIESRCLPNEAAKRQAS